MNTESPPLLLPADAGQKVLVQNLDGLLTGAASVKAVLAKGQQQYSTPSPWAARFVSQLPCSQPRTVIDWQCGAGNLLSPLDRADYIWGVDVDKRHASTTLPGCNLHRITASCLQVWDLLKEFFPAARFECQVVNPPFGLPWLASDFKLGRASSTAVTWKRVREFAAEGGYGCFIAGRAQLEALKIHEHPWTYLYQTFPSGLFPNADIEVGVVHWVNGGHPPRVTLPFTTLDPAEHPVLPPDLVAILRDRTQDWSTSYEAHTALQEVRSLIQEEDRLQPSHNYILKGGVLAVHFSHRFKLTHKLSSADLERLLGISGQHPLALVHEVQTRRLLKEVIERRIFTISPGAEQAIREALVQAAQLATPIMPVTDFERVAYVDELDELTVRDDFKPSDYDWELSFQPGRKYAHSTGTYTFRDKFTRKKVHYNEEEERTFTLEHQCELTGQDRFISVTDDRQTEHRFMDRPDRTRRTQWREHPENILWHIFVKPEVPTVAEELAPEVVAARERLHQLAATMLP